LGCLEILKNFLLEVIMAKIKAKNIFINNVCGGKQ